MAPFTIHLAPLGDIYAFFQRFQMKMVPPKSFPGMAPLASFSFTTSLHPQSAAATRCLGEGFLLRGSRGGNCKEGEDEGGDYIMGIFWLKT